MALKFNHMDSLDFWNEDWSFKPSASEIYTSKIRSKIKALIYPLFNGVTLTHYNETIQTEIKSKVDSLSKSFCENRNVDETNNDEGFFGLDVNKIASLFYSEFRSIELERKELEFNNYEKIFTKKGKLFSYYDNVILEKLQQKEWFELRNELNPEEDAKLYWKNRSQINVFDDKEIEMIEDDYINEFQLVFECFSNKFKHDIQSLTFEKFKDYIYNNIFISKWDEEYADCTKEEIEEVAKAFFKNRNIEEKERDEKVFVTVNDYTTWCCKAWEDITNDREWRQEQEEENEFENHFNFNDENFQQYGGPADGYGSRLGDDYINGALGGQPDANWNLD